MNSVGSNLFRPLRLQMPSIPSRYSKSSFTSNIKVLVTKRDMHISSYDSEYAQSINQVYMSRCLSKTRHVVLPRSAIALLHNSSTFAFPQQRYLYGTIAILVPQHWLTQATGRG